MQYAIFDIGADNLQWLGEASDPEAAIRAMWQENAYTADSFGNDPADEFIVVYQLQDAESQKIERLLSDGEHIFQDFEDEGQDLTFGAVLSLLGQS